MPLLLPLSSNLQPISSRETSRSLPRSRRIQRNENEVHANSTNELPAVMSDEFPKKDDKIKADAMKTVMSWLAGNPSRRRDAKLEDKSDAATLGDPLQREDSGSTFSSAPEGERWRQDLPRQDALNVHETILKYLRGSARAPIVSAHDLAALITRTCTDAFNQYTVPLDFQFFDFFERSIGAVVSIKMRK